MHIVKLCGKMEVGVEELCSVAVSIPVTQRSLCYTEISVLQVLYSEKIVRCLWTKQRSIQVVTGLSIAAGLLSSSDSAKKKEKRRMQSDYFWKLFLFLYSWGFWRTLDYWLYGCFYPRRRVLVHSKGPQFEITQPQEQVERRPWRHRRKCFKEEME